MSEYPASAKQLIRKKSKETVKTLWESNVVDINTLAAGSRTDMKVMYSITYYYMTLRNSTLSIYEHWWKVSSFKVTQGRSYGNQQW